MTAAETELDQAIQINRLQAEELEMHNNQTRRIITAFDEREQGLLDGINMVRDYKLVSALSSRLDELRYMRKEIGVILGSEGEDGITENICTV